MRLSGFRFDDDGTEFGYGVRACRARLGSLGGRLEYEQFDVDNTDGVELSRSALPGRSCNPAPGAGPGMERKSYSVTLKPPTARRIFSGISSKIFGTPGQVTCLIFRVLRRSSLPP